MDARNNTALLELSKVWELDGDWMKCRSCGRSLVASRDGEPLHHQPEGCRNSKHVHPWSDLRAAMETK